MKCPFNDPMIQWAQHVHTIYLTFDSCYMIALRLFVCFCFFLSFLLLTSYFHSKTIADSCVLLFFLFDKFQSVSASVFYLFCVCLLSFYFICTLPRNTHAERENDFGRFSHFRLLIEWPNATMMCTIAFVLRFVRIRSDPTWSDPIRSTTVHCTVSTHTKDGQLLMVNANDLWVFRVKNQGQNPISCSFSLKLLPRIANNNGWWCTFMLVFCV